jgi:DNA-binding transcriptional ArsR family regulator
VNDYRVIMNGVKKRFARAAEPDVAGSAALIGDPGRAAMLLALLDGRELPAAELAFRAGVSPQAATAHLKKLAAGNLVVARTSGRNRLFRLSSGDVGRAIEALASIAVPRPVVALDQQSTMARMRVARSCYDHLAGRLGVGVTERLVESGALKPQGDAFEVPRRGEALLGELGVDVASARDERRAFARACTDWTERRPHLAGGLGAALLALFVERAWVKRNAADRALLVTAAGTRALLERFGIEL